jgi:hypothetical protein
MCPKGSYWAPKGGSIVLCSPKSGALVQQHQASQPSPSVKLLSLRTQTQVELVPGTQHSDGAGFGFSCPVWGVKGGAAKHQLVWSTPNPPLSPKHCLLPSLLQARILCRSLTVVHTCQVALLRVMSLL